MKVIYSLLALVLISSTSWAQCTSETGSCSQTKAAPSAVSSSQGQAQLQTQTLQLPVQVVVPSVTTIQVPVQIQTAVMLQHYLAVQQSAVEVRPIQAPQLRSEGKQEQRRQIGVLNIDRGKRDGRDRNVRQFGAINIAR